MSYRLWTAHDDETVREMVRDGYTAAEIGDELRRSTTAVIKRMRELRMKSRVRNRPDAEMRSAVLGLLVVGVNRASDVARALGKHPRTGKNILGRLAKEGLARRIGDNRSARWFAAKRWTDGDGDTGDAA